MWSVNSDRNRSMMMLMRRKPRPMNDLVVPSFVSLKVYPTWSKTGTMEKKMSWGFFATVDEKLALLLSFIVSTNVSKIRPIIHHEIRLESFPNFDFHLRIQYLSSKLIFLINGPLEINFSLWTRNFEHLNAIIYIKINKFFVGTDFYILLTRLIIFEHLLFSRNEINARRYIKSILFFVENGFLYFVNHTVANYIRAFTIFRYEINATRYIKSILFFIETDFYILTKLLIIFEHLLSPQLLTAN